MQSNKNLDDIFAQHQINAIVKQQNDAAAAISSVQDQTKILASEIAIFHTLIDKSAVAEAKPRRKARNLLLSVDQARRV